MGFTSMSPKWAAILATVLTARSSTALYQSYCSSENTGSDYSSVYNQFMSNGACFTNCKDDYAFAIVQYQDCWCSNYIPAEQLSVSECNVECPGFGQEDCGNKQDGLFGYVALSKSPSGTAGFSSPTTAASAETTTPFVSSPTTTTTTAPSSSSTTTSQVVTPSSTTPAIAATVTSIVTEAPTTSSTTSKTATPVTSTQIVTISGAIVTQTVTTTPSPVPSSGSDQEGIPTKSSSNNTGAIVGGVVGGIAGIVLIVAAVFFCIRRRNAGHPTTTSKLDRNASILSRAGLVASTNNRDPEKTAEDSYGGQRGSGNFNENENSSVTNSGGVYERSDSLGRRNSRPLVYDQRLNPAALMENWQLNGSRSSINTMQDQRDYSRPLGITNPDPHDGI